MSLSLSVKLFFESWELFSDAVWAGVLGGAGLGFLGVYIVARRMIFLSAALSQAAGLGVTLAFYLQIHVAAAQAVASPVLGATLMTLLAAGLLMTGRRKQASQEALVGGVFLLGSSGSLIVGTRIVQELQDIQTLLFGTAVAVVPADLLAMLVVIGGVGLVHVVAWRGFVEVATDPEGAKVRGLPVRALELTLVMTLAVAISMVTRVLGALPAFAFSVLPALAARRWMSNPQRAMLMALIIGAASGFFGYLLAFLLELPVGAAQTVVAASFAGLFVALSQAKLRLMAAR